MGDTIQSSDVKPTDALMEISPVEQRAVRASPLELNTMAESCAVRHQSQDGYRSFLSAEDAGCRVCGGSEPGAIGARNRITAEVAP